MEKLQLEPDSASGPPVDLVREHLTRVLASPHFRTSKRCSEFLTFVVDQTLEGHRLEIKERTIGAAVFGRPLDYETPADPIVRVKANEVRKRLAQYYGEAGAEETLQIELPAGAYVPLIHWRNHHVAAPRPFTRPAIARPDRSRKYLAYGAGCAILLLAAGYFNWKRTLAASAFDEFWAPVLHSSGLPLICVGASDTWIASRRLRDELERLPTIGDANPVRILPRDLHHMTNFHMSTGNAESVFDLSVLLAGKGAAPELRLGGVLSIQDIAAHPVISIGAFNNPWTIRGNSELRFSFEGDGTDDDAPLSIRDRLHSENRWVVSGRVPWKQQTVDYALISRLFDPASGNVFITLAGINSFGSQAAGEFVTNPRYWKNLAENAPAGWQKKNLQIVLETTVVGMMPSPPRVLATHFW